MLHAAIVVRQKGTIHGNGLFATQLIQKGTLVWKLTDPTYKLAEVQALSGRRRKEFDWYGFQCGVDRYSLPDGDCREFNHSCNPNTWWSGSEILVARRDIQIDEEVTYDYSTCDIELEFAIECHCGDPNCRGSITNRDYLCPQWQQQYGNNLPHHVLSAIKHKDSQLNYPANET